MCFRFLIYISRIVFFFSFFFAFPGCDIRDIFLPSFLSLSKYRRYLVSVTKLRTPTAVYDSFETLHVLMSLLENIYVLRIKFSD